MNKAITHNRNGNDTLTAHKAWWLKRRLGLAVGIVISVVTPAWATLITEPTRYFNVGSGIPDGQDLPSIFQETITDSAIMSLTQVEIGLHLVGDPNGSGFASDMYAALNKNLGQTSILLNQVGITTIDPIGATYGGWDVTFSDGAANGDIHLASASGVLTGLWAPDGRTDPVDTKRLQMLSVFNGGTGDGDWYLAIGDLALGGTMRLESWSITLSGETQSASVPDGGSTLGLIALGLAAVWCVGHDKRNKLRAKSATIGK